MTIMSMVRAVFGENTYCGTQEQFPSDQKLMGDHSPAYPNLLGAVIKHPFALVTSAAITTGGLLVLAGPAMMAHFNACTAPLGNITDDSTAPWANLTHTTCGYDVSAGAPAMITGSMLTAGGVLLTLTGLLVNKAFAYDGFQEAYKAPPGTMAATEDSYIIIGSQTPMLERAYT